MKIIVILCLFLLPVMVFSQTITVVTENWPPYNYEENGEITGISTDIVKATLKEAGIKAKIVIYPWARAYRMALYDSNVLIYTISRNEERERLFKWVAPITRPIRAYLYKLKKRDDIVIHGLDDAKKYITGVMRNDDSHNFLLSQGFEDEVNIELVTTEEQNIKKLYAGRIDFIVQSDVSLAVRLKNLGLSIHDLVPVYTIYEGSGEGSYMAFSTKTPDSIVKKVKAAFEKLSEEGIVDTIYNKYMGN